MRYTYFSILVLILISGTAVAQQKLTLIPDQPQRGQKLTIRYDPSVAGASIPAAAENIDMVFTYSNFYEYPWRMPLMKKGKYWEASIVVPHYATYATFYLQSGDAKDQPAPNRHFEIPVYYGGQRVENSFLYEQYSLQAQMGKVPELEAKKAELLKKELAQFPDNYEAKLRLLNYKMATGNEEDKIRYREEARKVIADKFYENPGKNGFMNKTTMGYLIIGENTRLDSIRKIVRSDFPESEVGYGMRINEIAQEDDTAVMARKMLLLLRNENAGNKNYFSGAHERLFKHYAALKNTEKAFYHLDNINKDFTPYTPETLKEQAEILLNAGIGLDRALKLAKHALILSDTFEVGLTRHFPETGHIPSFISREDRKISTTKNTAVMKSVIALILNKLEFEEDAAKNMAEALELSTDPETLANAGAFYQETGNPAQAFEVYKQIMLQVPEDTVSLALMKLNYEKTGKSASGWKSILDELNSHWKNEMVDELKKEIVNIDAPEFINALVDLKGKPVSASILKNKVVVINFWATWCVPCMKEMPYMQNAYNSYKSNKEVEFMIINSGSNNSLQDAQGWWGNKTYDFPVFYNKDRTIGTKFGFNVIPATYIFDQKGNIRFKIIGFEGAVIQRKVEVAIDMLLAGE